MISKILKKALQKTSFSNLERELATKANRGSYIPTILNSGILLEILEEMKEIRKLLLSDAKVDLNIKYKEEEISDFVEVVEEEPDKIAEEDKEEETIEEDKEEEKPKHELSASTKRRLKEQRKKKK